MLRRTAACLLVLFVFITLSITGFSQEAKKDVKKESKTSATTNPKAPVNKDQGKDSKKPKAPPSMKSIACPQPGCGLWAKSRSAKELRILMKRHARVYHKTDLTLQQLKAMVTKHEQK
ncbi:MAG: hypothetical protein KF749_10270 [Bacteroidetes bacterium]|nr:hypothetical protein [Bacteroidota bacterium]MCW5896652.1 hypothetical protein [Bacteroidota bacterium]